MNIFRTPAIVMESTKVFLVENVDWELSRSSSTLKVLDDAAVCVEPVFVLFRHCFFLGVLVESV